MITTIADGIYRDMNFERYRSIEAVNRSLLDTLIDFSPMHCRFRRDNPEPDTPALLIGRALHAAVLEPGVFATAFTESGQCAATQKNGKRCERAGKFICVGKWYCGKHEWEGQDDNLPDILKAEQMEAVCGMRDAIMASGARNFIDSRGGDDANEITLISTDKETGLRKKARFDLGRWSYFDCVADIKTTVCARLSEFQRAITTYRYHRQAAFYQDVAAEIGAPFKHFAIIAVEKEPPHGVALYRMRDIDIEAGRDEVRTGLRSYAKCIETGIWPGYGDQFQDIGMTDWGMKQVIENSRERAEKEQI